MKQYLKSYFIVLLVAMLAFSFLACDSGGETSDTSFTWWITDDDSQGTYYTGYEENPGVQWLNAQNWEFSDEGTEYSVDGSGVNFDFSFMTPVKGSEQDNFNTMMATGSYPEIVSLAFATDSPKQLVEDGTLMEITEYVEAYMPDYIQFIEDNPSVEPFVRETDENGDHHYYALWGFNDSPVEQWQGPMYRRDWIVKYAEPTSHVWDYESAFVQNNNHPKHTPLSEAISQGDLTGWKENTVTEFTSNFGTEETWEDNIIFPSGTNQPVYISDWEWMFEAFMDAIEAEGFNDNNNAYVTTLYYLGYTGLGDLTSSFGGGGATWYVAEDGNAEFGGTGDNFKTYLKAMHSWYEKGWLDQQFDTRGSDSFFRINQTGVAQGMVGQFTAGVGMLGTTIRATAENDEAQNDAMVFPTAWPINDVYGDQDNKFKEPNMYYGGSKLASATGFTNKLEGKDLESLFRLINWMYTHEGALVTGVGLNEEQVDAVNFDPDVYAEHDLEAAYHVIENDDDTVTYKTTVPGDSLLYIALRPNRIATKLQLVDDVDYYLDTLRSPMVERSKDLWRKYDNSGQVLDYNGLFDEEQSALYSRLYTYMTDVMGVEVPKLIKNGLEDWDIYVSKIQKYGPERMTSVYQEILDEELE